ncbi:hypothetical protein VUR80DRAFT_6734 [Thermomyces stellatus]
METLTKRRCRARLRLEQSVDEPRRAADLARTLCVICQEFGHTGKSCFYLRKKSGEGCGLERTSVRAGTFGASAPRIDIPNMASPTAAVSDEETVPFPAELKGPFPKIPTTVQGRTIDPTKQHEKQPSEQCTIDRVGRCHHTGISVRRLLKVRIRGDEPVRNITRGQNVDAIYAYLTGEVAEQECTRCQAGVGPFQECVKHDGIGSGSCSNCHYNSEGVKCSFRPDTAGGSTKRGRTAQKKSARKDNSDNDEQRVVFVPREALRPLRKLKAEHWTAIGQLAREMATGNWIVREESSSGDDDSDDDNADHGRGGKKQRRK